jgi:hypothetical protein
MPIPRYANRDLMESDRMDTDNSGDILSYLNSGIPAKVAPAMAAGSGTGLDELLAQPTPTAGVASLPAKAAPKNLGKPIYAVDRQGNNRIVGYEQDPEVVKAGKIETPKPPEILAKEKELGHELEPIYAEGEVKHGSGTSSTKEYGEPIGYRYDNGKSQYVSFDTSGQQTGIRERSNLGTLVRDLAPLALTAVGANFLAPYLAGGAGAAVGAGEGAAGIGAASHLTPAALEALAGTAGYGTSAAAEAALAAGAGGAGITSLAAPITETAGEIATGTNAAGAGGYGSGAANPSLLSSTGTGATGAGAAGIGGASHLTPAALESLMGTAGYGVNASALEAATALGVPAAQVGSGASSAFPGVTPTMPKLTPAQLESLAGTPGYGKSAAALAAATAAGIDPNIVGSGADLPFPGVNPTPGIGDLLKKVKDKVLGSSDSSSGSGGVGLGGALGLMALMSMMNKGGGGTPASTATIPELTANRTQLPYDVNKAGVNPNTPYRPGQGGVNYFSPTTYTPTPPKAAGGGLMSLGQSNLGSYSDGGRLLQGPGDGVSDSIPAIIGHKQPARLANGEFVIPARIVSELGNGSTDAGAKRLYEMMDRVQSVRRKTKNVAANTKASKYLPA